MRSYIKIYGPPVYDALKSLEKLAIDVPQVCTMDPLIQQLYVDDVGGWSGPESGPSTSDAKAMEYFVPLKRNIGPERCGKIISKYEEKLGGSNFFFEWFKNPTMDELNDLIKMIDKSLAQLGCKYTITSKIIPLASRRFLKKWENGVRIYCFLFFCMRS